MTPILDAFTNAVLGAATDPFVILPAVLIGWFVSRWTARFTCTLGLAAALTIAVLWLLGEMAALSARDEGAYLAAGIAARLSVAFTIAEIIAFVERRAS